MSEAKADPLTAVRAALQAALTPEQAALVRRRLLETAFSAPRVEGELEQAFRDLGLKP